MQRMTGVMRAAIDRYSMIEPGDLIGVGVSGGKDSMALLAGLAALREYYPKKYDIIALTADPCFDSEQTDYSEIERFCADSGIEYRIRRTELAAVVERQCKGKNPCSLCARMRRGILHAMAKDAHCSRLALGHHGDDAIETLLMNMFDGGTVSCFRPVTYLTKRELYVIRPLIFCSESSIESLVRRLELPTVASRCPVDKKTERERVKRLVANLGSDYPDIKAKLLGALERGGISGW